MLSMRSAVSAAAATAILAMSACSTATETATETPADPSAEPVLDGAFTLYSGRSEDLIAPLIEDFAAITGIDVEVRYAESTELAALLLEEGSATPADVFLSQDAGALGAVSNTSAFAPLPADITDSVAAGFTSADGSWVGVTGRARVIVYDAEQISAEEVPTSVHELTDPKWKGQVGIAPTNASFQSFVTAMRVLEGEDAAREWLEAMVANDVQIYAKNGAIRDAVNAGEIQLGLINHYYWYQLSNEVGEENMRAQLSFPTAGDPGSIVNVTGAGLLADAASDGDALAFIEYLMSTDGQQYFVDNTYEYPLVGGVDAPAGLPPLADLTNAELDLGDLDSLEATTALLAEVGLV